MSRKFSSSVVISRTDWAGLQTGRIVRIHGANGTTVSYADETFVLEGRNGYKQMLYAPVTDDRRLNAHFSGFQTLCALKQQWTA